MYRGRGLAIGLKIGWRCVVCNINMWVGMWNFYLDNDWKHCMYVYGFV